MPVQCFTYAITRHATRGVRGVVVSVAPGAHHAELLTMSLLQSTTATIEAKPGDTAIRVLTDFYGVPKMR